MRTARLDGMETRAASLDGVGRPGGGGLAESLRLLGGGIVPSRWSTRGGIRGAVVV